MNPKPFTPPSHDSARARRYPAAAHAMLGFLIIERLPAAQKSPKYPPIMWPDYEALPHADHYSHFIESENNTPAKPHPHDIDRAEEWIKPCQWMWQVGRDRRDWQMFCAYAFGVAVQNIADHHSISRGYASNLLDSIFYQIQVEAEIEQLRRHDA